MLIVALLIRATPPGPANWSICLDFQILILTLPAVLDVPEPGRIFAAQLIA